jgi:hypothetical protein
VEPDDPPLGRRDRVARRLQAAELVARAMETSNTVERDRLLAEAYALIAKAHRDVRPQWRFAVIFNLYPLTTGISGSDVRFA